MPAFSYMSRAQKKTPYWGPLYFYHLFSFYSRGRLDLLRSLSRVALKPASSLASSSDIFVLPQSIALKLSKPALRPSLCASCGLKFWQGSKVRNSCGVEPCWDSNSTVSSPREPRFVSVPIRFAPEAEASASPRPGLAGFA